MTRDQLVHFVAGMRVTVVAGMYTPEVGIDLGVIDRLCNSLADEWSISAEELVAITQAFYDLITPILEGGHIQ